MNVFDLFAKISLDTKEYESALSSAHGMAEGFGSKLKSIIGSATQFVGDSLKTAGKLGAGFVTDSIRTGEDFDKAMSQVAATMGTTVSEIGDLRDFAREMGETTKYSATEAAEALNYMALAGYDADTSMSMLPNVLNLASAGNFDLARASDMVTDTQTAFGISLERTTQLVDEMAKAASTGNTSVEQLGDAFLTVGGLAQELNGGFVTLADGTRTPVDGVQELEIALTAMANAGIKGSEAGTHMRNMLLKLASPAAEGAEVFEEIGVSAFDAEGNMRSLSDVFGDLSTALGGMTQQKKLDAISKLFNTRDTASAEALLAAVGEDWDHIGESILNAQDAAAKMAEEQENNLSGDITKFKSALDGLKITVSDQITPYLRDAVQEGTNWVGNLKDYFEIFMANGLGQTIRFIQSDLEPVKKLIDNVLEQAPEMAKQFGEAAPQAIGDFIVKLTDPEAKGKIMKAGFDVIGGLIDGLLSQESIDAIVEKAPIVVDNMVQGFISFLTGPDQDGEGGLLGLAKNIVVKIGNYFADEKNREDFRDAARNIITSLGMGLVNILQNGVAPLMVEVARAWAECFVGEIDYNDAAIQILKRLGSAFVSNMLHGGILGEILTENQEMQDYLDAPFSGTQDDWDRLSYNEKIDYLTQDTNQDTRFASDYMLEHGYLTGAAADAYRKYRGYATGFVAPRPAFLSGVQVGERGTEVLLPLESNTGWMDTFADKLSSRLGGGVMIQFGDIYVSGGEDAGRAVIEQIDSALRQYQIAQARGIGGSAWQS
ncbi:MAG TPA: phage tail tape measure protein [Ruminococcus sp.]|nr:phage tail tape measure protein [Ruminococcus sp.]